MATIVPTRVILIVIDSLGIGELPDAASYGDEGSNTLRNIDKPAFVIGHQGLTLENGMLLPWNNIVENIWVNQDYMGIPIGKQIQIRTDLPKPQARVLRRATALEISGDEYLALCDAYR